MTQHTIYLTSPPSVWKLYQGWGQKRHLSPAYKKWRDANGYLVQPSQRNNPIVDPFTCHIKLRRQNTRSDLDNYAKACLDFMQHHGVIKNDNLLETLYMEWADDLLSDWDCVIRIWDDGKTSLKIQTGRKKT